MTAAAAEMISCVGASGPSFRDAAAPDPSSCSAQGGAAALGLARASPPRSAIVTSIPRVMFGLDTVRLPGKSSMLSARRFSMTGPLGLSVGQRARRTQTVTAKEVELYAQITGDRHPLHFDADLAKRTRFGRLVAQGGIAAGMLNALVAMDLPGAGTVFMSQSLKYLAPTYLGDTLTAEVEVLSLKPDKPVCQLRATITNQDGTVLLEGECWTYTMRPS